MTGGRGRPMFTTQDSDDGEGASLSRSTSNERDFEAAYERANPHRTRSSSSGIRPNTFGIHIPPGIDEEAVECEASGEASERTPFMVGERTGSKIWTSSPVKGAPASRNSGAPYGTFVGDTRSFSSGHFLQLNAQAPPGLSRTTSIFKLSGMIDDREGDFEKFRMPDERMKEFSKPVREFYEAQNEILDGFAEVDEILENTRALATTGELAPIIPTKPSASADRAEALHLTVKLAVNVNFILNFFLLGAKIAIVVLSSSMSLVASTVDSAMDFLSTMIIFGTSRIIDNRDWKSNYNYPTGKRRMEPMSVVVFSVFMIASFLQVFIESVERLLDKNLETAIIPLIGKIIMIATIVAKSVVWAWCRRIKNSSVEALTQDAENDIVFNFFSLLFPFVGEQLGWRYLDPLGGALLSLYIMVEWTETLLDNVKKLTGRRASPGQHQRVAYLITRFSPLIKGIQHLSVYHTGDSFIVETDIVLPQSTDLTTAHNIGESAQYGLEQLDGVERAFVHLDVTVNPLSGHVAR